VSPLAVAFVVVAAAAHATWNLLLKQVAEETGPPFIWLSSVLQTCLLGPFVVAYLAPRGGGVSPGQVLFVFGSAAIHCAYFLLLQRGYRVGDLSIVYPLARGFGPALSIVAAIMLFGERPGPVALGGASLVVVGVLVLARPPGRRPEDSGGHAAAVAYGLLTGASIAVYTLWDKHGVAALDISPLLYIWLQGVGMALFLGPVILPHRRDLALTWASHRRAAFGLAVLSPLAYGLVLAALQFTPVSYVAPARELSIVFGTAMGSKLLAEPDATRRLVASGAIVAGVGVLALG
jgi:drug/metabolite transporter (DMT)-like permease